MKLILEVYQAFTYPSPEGRACSVARLCDTQAVSLIYLQTTYVVSTQHIHISQPYVNIFTSFFIFHHTVDLTSEISCLLLLSISCHHFQYPCLTSVFKCLSGHYLCEASDSCWGDCSVIGICLQNCTASCSGRQQFGLTD